MVHLVMRGCVQMVPVFSLLCLNFNLDSSSCVLCNNMVSSFSFQSMSCVLVVYVSACCCCGNWFQICWVERRGREKGGKGVSMGVSYFDW